MIQAKDIRLLPIRELRVNPKNRNQHPDDQIRRLAEIIKYQGFRNPVIVSTRSGLVVAGHGRLEAAKRLGLVEVPVMLQDFESEEQEYAAQISDNAIALWADLDLAGINADLTQLGPDFDIDLLGIEDFVLEPAEKFEAQCDEDEVPEHVEPKTKLGDIYQLGQHRLMCGDSTSIDAVERLMDGTKADMVFTDPPYNQETDGGEKGPIGSAFAKQSREIEHLCHFEPETFLNILPMVFKDNKLNAYCFCNKDLVVNYLKWARDAGYSYNILIWKKPCAIPIGGSYRPDIEYLLVFRKSGIFNSGLVDCSYSKVLEHKREQNKVHPTMKPVELIENQIRIASNDGSAILDFFGGSGSTLIACEKTNRKCFMMELDSHYVDVIVARWCKYTGKNKVILNGEEIEWKL